MADLSRFIIPKSDQMNAEDLVKGQITAQIKRVVTHPDAKEQPVHIHLDGFPGRPWKPCKTMLRLLIVAWGSESDAWIGRWVRFYRDPTVRFGGDDVGGIRVNGLSDIPAPIEEKFATTKGKRGKFRVEPIDPPGDPAVHTIRQAIRAAMARGWTKEEVRALLGVDRAEDVPAPRHAEVLAALAAEHAREPGQEG